MEEDELLGCLTKPISQKTSAVIKAKENLDEFKIIDGNIIMYLFVYLILSFLLIFKFDEFIYTNYIIFKKLFSFASNSSATHEKIYVITLLLISLSLIMAYEFYKGQISKQHALKQRFDRLRIDLIDSINIEFCMHERLCTIKENYYDYMEGLKIDIIFKQK